MQLQQLLGRRLHLHGPGLLIAFGDTARAVRTIVSSPDSKHLVVVYGEGRGYVSPSVQGAELFRREGDTFVGVAALPIPSARIAVRDGGASAVLVADHQSVDLVHLDSSAVERSRQHVIGGLQLSDPFFALLAPGDKVLVGATDRDDGHGYSDPVYTDFAYEVVLETGRIDEGRDRTVRGHVLRAPGRPWLSTFDGGDRARLDRIVRALPFRREWPRSVGRRRLLTSARVIDVASGATLLGEKQEDMVAWPKFCDLSEDEGFVVGWGPQCVLELWDVDARTKSTQPIDDVRCAILLSTREIAVGTGKGAFLTKREST